MPDVSTKTTNAQIQFEAIFEHSPNIIVYTGLERELVRVNRRFVEATGYTEEECLGRTTKFLYAHAEDYGQTGLKRYNYNVDAPLQKDAFVLEYRRKDGSTFFGETVGVPLRDGDDQVLGYMAVVRDLTEQLEFEAARRRMLTELERSRAFLAETKRIARIGGGELDVATGEVTWSAGFNRLHGLPEGADLSLEQVLELYDAESRAAIEEALERAATDGQPFDLELPLMEVRDSQMWVRIAASPVFEGDEISKIRGFVQDITEQKQAEQEKLEFLAMVSHELRAPLTALLGTLELMKIPQDRKAADMSQLVPMALRSGKRLGALINDILDVRKLESGQLNLELDRFDVCDVVEDVVLANRGLAQTLDVDLRVSRSVARSDVRLDAGRLEQVLTNLISNAIKFSPAGEVVDVEAKAPEQGRVRIEVVDRGPGIPANFQGELFDKFTQATSSRRGRGRGTGLGLNIAKGLTEQMGGRIGFETTPGEGTTMYVEFPVVD